MPLSDRITIIPRRLLQDERGWFLKVIDGTESHLPGFTGEIYLTSALPGHSKGGHYHYQANEWFSIIRGAAELQLADIETREQLVISLSMDNPSTIYVPCKVAHSFVNISETEECIVLAYTDRLYDPQDTVPFQL